MNPVLRAALILVGSALVIAAVVRWVFGPSY